MSSTTVHTTGPTLSALALSHRPPNVVHLPREGRQCIRIAQGQVSNPIGPSEIAPFESQVSGRAQGKMLYYSTTSKLSNHLDTCSHTMCGRQTCLHPLQPRTSARGFLSDPISFSTLSPQPPIQASTRAIVRWCASPSQPSLLDATIAPSRVAVPVKHR